MKKKKYIAPAISITVCDMKCSFLAASDPSPIKQWGPDNDIGGIYEEGDGDLEDDEITG